MKRYPNLDWIRLFLASEVVLFHLSGALNPGHPLAMPIQPVMGFVALSGFLIVGSLKSSETIAHFWLKRLLRIAPAFVLSLILVLLLFGLPQVGRCLVTWATLGQDRSSVNYPLWSLSCEELLYVILALIFLFGGLNSRRGCVVFAISSYLAFLIMHEGLHLFGQQTPLLASFGIGVAASAAPDAFTALGRSTVSRVIALAIAILSSLLLIYPRGAPPVLCDVAYCAAPLATSAALLAIGLGPAVRPVGTDYSYGLYIYHAPLITYCQSFAPKGWQLVGASLSATAAITVASAYALERPLLRLKSRLRRNPGALMASDVPLTPVVIESK